MPFETTSLGATLKRRLLAAVVFGFASSAALAQVAAVDWPGNPQHVYNNGPFMMGDEFSVSISPMALGSARSATQATVS